MIKGFTEYDKFQRGEKLTAKEAIAAHCFDCGDFEAGLCIERNCLFLSHCPFEMGEESVCPFLNETNVCRFRDHKKAGE